jgi:hypothetical protein
MISIIRAHEAQIDGYKMYKWNTKSPFPTVITIFSAPNYCDTYKNKGAVIKFDVCYCWLRTIQWTFNNITIRPIHTCYLTSWMYLHGQFHLYQRKSMNWCTSCWRLINDSPSPINMLFRWLIELDFWRPCWRFRKHSADKIWAWCRCRACVLTTKWLRVVLDHPLGCTVEPLGIRMSKSWHSKVVGIWTVITRNGRLHPVIFDCLLVMYWNNTS